MNGIGVDVGGTRIAAGVVTPEGEVLNEGRRPSSGPTEKLLSSIARAINEVGGGASATGASILDATCREVSFRVRSPYRDLAEIEQATPGPESGVPGAGALVRDGSGEYVLGT